MSSTARLKCPFTSLGVAPEAASSYLLPQLIGRQNAAWLLMSSEWVDAAEALRMGLVWRVCEPDELLADARRHAEVLASRPISSLMAVKQTMVEPLRPGIAAATARENALFAEADGRGCQRRGAGGLSPRQVIGQCTRAGLRRVVACSWQNRLPVHCRHGGSPAVAAKCCSMMARTVRRHRPQSPPAPQAAATCLDVDAPRATASLTVALVAPAQRHTYISASLSSQDGVAHRTY